MELRRTRIGPFDVADADPERLIGLQEALAFLPHVALEGERAKAAGHGVGVECDAAGDGPFLLTDADGAIAIAERQGDLLKPVVGFRA